MLFNLFLGRAAEAAVAQLIRVIVDRNAVFNKNSLHEALPLRQRKRLSFTGSR